MRSNYHMCATLEEVRGSVNNWQGRFANRPCCEASVPMCCPIRNGHCRLRCDMSVAYRSLISLDVPSTRSQCRNLTRSGCAFRCHSARSSALGLSRRIRAHVPLRRSAEARTTPTGSCALRAAKILLNSGLFPDRQCSAIIVDSGCQ